MFIAYRPMFAASNPTKVAYPISQLCQFAQGGAPPQLIMFASFYIYICIYIYICMYIYIYIYIIAKK